MHSMINFVFHFGNIKQKIEMQSLKQGEWAIKVHYSNLVDSDVQESGHDATQKNQMQQQNQIAKQGNIDREQNHQQITNILQKLINFIRFHNVDSADIWNQKKEIKVSEFVHIISSNYSYSFSRQQVTTLSKIGFKRNYLKSTDFQRFDLWKQEPKSINQLLSSFNLQKSRQKLNRTKCPNDSFNNWFNEESNVSSEQNQKHKLRNHKQNVKFSIRSRKNLNHESYQEVKRYSEGKVRMRDQELKKDIKESVLQKKWDFIVMAGEMNQWIDQLKKQGEKQIAQKIPEAILSYRYKIINKDPVEIIQQNVDLKAEEQIPHVVFVKKYQTLKKRMVKQENQKNNLKGTVLMVLEQNDKLTKNNLNNRINQRDQQLNFVLLQIMRMKSLFQWQNGILKQARINS